MDQRKAMEQRKAEQWLLRFPVQYKRHGRRDVRTGICQNLSGGGLTLVVDEPLQPHEPQRFIEFLCERLIQFSLDQQSTTSP